MTAPFRRTFCVVALALVTIGVSARADAECFSVTPQRSGLFLPQAPSYEGRTAAFQNGTGTPGAIDPATPVSIVGLWHVVLTTVSNSVGIPPGTVIDDAYATWHSDGTELMNSSRPPISGNFCMGVWSQSGPRTYKLKHIALAWNSTGTVFEGPAIIRQDVTVSPANHTYEGTFTLDQYAPDGTTLLAHIEGTVSANRITP
jgi:hypothetical protein